MKGWSDIFRFTQKLLLILAVVLMLGACAGKEDEVVIGEIDTSDALCLSCSILELMYKAAGSNVMHMHAAFTGAAMPIMMVGFSIWLALRLLKFVSSVTETNAGEVWNEIIRKAFVCLICGLLASSSGALMFTLNTLIFPVYRAFMELGLDILNASLDASKEQPRNFVVFGTEMKVQGVSLGCDIEGDFRATEDGFPTSLMDAMKCMLQVLSAYLTLGAEVAIETMQEVPSITGRFIGIILYLFFWVVKIGFTFYLVDMVFQMGIIILLLPLYILSYAFGPTQKWAKMGFSHILASAGFLMCFSIIVSLVLVSMISLIENNPSIFNPEPVKPHLQDLSIGFICLLLIGFLIYGSMGVSQQLTSTLIGAKVSANFQRNLKAAVQGIGGAILSGIGAIFTWGMSLAPQSSIKLIRTIGKANEKIKAYRAKMRRLAGRR